MESHIKAAGVAMIILAMTHVAFPRYFNWRDEFASLSLINREMAYVHTFFIALMLLLLGVLSVTSAKDLISTDLGHRICLGIGVFWSARLIIQLFGYSSKLWRRKYFETSVHIVFLVLWSYLSSVFLLASF